MPRYACVARASCGERKRWTELLSNSWRERVPDFMSCNAQSAGAECSANKRLSCSHKYDCMCNRPTSRTCEQWCIDGSGPRPPTSMAPCHKNSAKTAVTPAIPSRTLSRNFIARQNRMYDTGVALPFNSRATLFYATLSRDC